MIIIKYIKTWLVLDILSLVPFDLLVSSSNENLSEITKFARIFKLLKIIRLVKFSEKLSQNRNTKKITNLLNGNKQAKDFFSFFIIILILTHITACLWFFLTKIQGNVNWTIKINFENSNVIDKYLASFYWAISTICTVGFGDITAVTSLEKIFNIIWICVGVAFYSYTIGTLSSILNYNNK